MKAKIFLILIFSTCICVQAKDKERRIHSYEFNSSMEAFLQRGNKIRSLYPDSLDFIENPKGTVLKNIWCWSKADSWPNCETVFMGDNDSVLLFVQKKKMNATMSLIYKMRWCSDSTGTKNCTSEDVDYYKDLYDWIPQMDDLLMLKLGSNVGNIRKIRLIKEEETDRLWGVMEGIGIGFLVGLAAMVIELPVSFFMNNAYNWNHVLFSSVGTAAGYSTFRVITYDTDPRTLRVTINITNF